MEQDMAALRFDDELGEGGPVTANCPRPFSSSPDFCFSQSQIAKP
jgi:hypothetical protein